MSRRCRGARRRAAGIAALLAAWLSAEVRAAAQSAPTATLAATAAILALTHEETAALDGGRSVTRLLPAASSDEMIMVGAVWIDAPAADYLLAIRDIERFECGGDFAATRRLSEPPTAEDFAAISLTPGDLKDLRSCLPGKCGVKLTPSAQKLLSDVDWSSPAADDIAAQRVRRMAFSIVAAYGSAGNSALGPYVDERPLIMPGPALSEIIGSLPVLSPTESVLRRFLIAYPNGTLPDSTSFFYWQMVQFGLKPTIRINHVVVVEYPNHSFVASKQLYASHYFRAALEIRHVISDSARGRGFWLVHVSAARVDGLGGMLGALVRGRVQGEALSSLAGGLLATKTKIEALARPARASEAFPGDDAHTCVHTLRRPAH